MYSGREPEFTDGDVFKTIVPLNLQNDDMSDNSHRQMILDYLKKHNVISTSEAANIIGRSPATTRRVLTGLVTEGIITTSGANKNRVYFIPE